MLFLTRWFGVTGSDEDRSPDRERSDIKEITQRVFRCPTESSAGRIRGGPQLASRNAVPEAIGGGDRPGSSRIRSTSLNVISPWMLTPLSSIWTLGLANPALGWSRAGLAWARCSWSACWSVLCALVNVLALLSGDVAAMARRSQDYEQ